MLSQEAYIAAMVTYVGAALVALALTAWWLRSYWRPAWIALVVLIGAALSLTPAYPGADITTLAPALIVVAFQWLTAGPAEAEHALRPLLFMLGLALAVAAVLGLTVLRHRPARPDTGAPDS